jgi:hypothetical protein
MARRSPGMLVAVVVVVASALGLASSLVTAQAPAPQLLSVQIVNVKPEAVNDWLALQQKETIPALKKAGVPAREGWTTNVSGEAFEYFFSTPITKFAEYDNSQPPIVRALGQEGARIYNDKLRRMIVGQRTLAITVFPESIMPPASYVPKFMVLNFNYTVPGRSGDYAAYLRNDFMPAIRKAKPVAYGVSRTGHGGDPNEFVTARYMEKMADLDGPNLLQLAIGADGAAKLQAKTAGMIQRQERRIFRFVPELSFAPGTRTSSQQ